MAESPLPASSDGTNTTLSDDNPRPPSSPSFSLDSAPESDGSSSSSVVSDVSSGFEPVVAKKLRPPVRSWPAADEIALLEAVAAHREEHGRLPSPDDLAVALRGRLRSDDRLGADQVAKRLHTLRVRYDNAAIRLSRGIIPVKDDDVRIYKLSKLIWAATRKKKKEDRAADARQDRRGFGELAGLYPCLAAEVETIDAGCGAPASGVLKRAFGRIGDSTAARLEAKMQKQRVAETRASAELDRLKRNVASALLRLIK